MTRHDTAATASGVTVFHDKVMQRIAETVVLDIPGTLDVDAKLAGIAGRELPRFDIDLDNDQSTVAIKATVAVQWPSPITQVATETRAAIAEAIEEFTGFRVQRVNITVGDTLASQQRITAEAVAHRPSYQAISPEAAPVKMRDITNGAADFQLREITVDKHTEFRSVDIPRPAPLRPASAPKPQPLRGVQAPEPTPVKSPTIGEHDG